jgi:ribonuclease P protein component
MARYTLSKQKRLSGKKNIETLFLTGEAFFVHPYRVTYKLVQDLSCPVRVAVVAPKKHFKKAVDRNTIKRKIKEAYRLQQYSLNINTLLANQLSLHFIMVYSIKQQLPYDEITTQMSKVISKLNQMIDHKIDTNAI